METNWQEKATNIIKSEMARRGVSIEQLQKKLALIDVEETTNSISIKICRGAFKFSFFLQVMKAIGAKTLRFDDDD